MSTRTAFTILGIIVALLAITVLQQQMVIAWHLLVGWIAYLQRTLPQITLNREALLGAAACLIGVIILTHWLGRWLYREMSSDLPEHRRWRLGWTTLIVVGVMLMFVAGIAAVGVAHQSAWLARSGEPMFSSRRPQADSMRCGSNLRQIGQALLLYAYDNGGALPEGLGQLPVVLDMSFEVLCCPATATARPDGRTPSEQASRFGPENLDYVYHARGLTMPLPPDRPIVCEPISNHGTGMNVLFGDGRVEFVEIADAERIMRRVDAGQSAGPERYR